MARGRASPDLWAKTGAGGLWRVFKGLSPKLFLRRRKRMRMILTNKKGRTLLRPLSKTHENKLGYQQEKHTRPRFFFMSPILVTRVKSSFFTKNPIKLREMAGTG
jgi:hypothetical protein